MLLKLYVLLSEDIQRRFRPKRLIFPSIFFVLIPMAFIIISYFVSLMFKSFSFSIIPEDIFSESSAVSIIQQMHLILSYFVMGTIAWPIYVIIQGGTTFSPRVKDGTIKMIVSKPVGRVEIYLSKLLEFTILASVFPFLSLLIQDLLISLLFGRSLLPFLFTFSELTLIWLIIFLLLMLIYSITTAINALTFSTIFSIIFGMSYFIAWPFIFSSFGSSIPYIFLSNPNLDNDLGIVFLNILYGINPGYYLYSLLLHGYQVLYGIVNPLTSSSNLLVFYLPLYPAGLQDSIVILTGLFLIPSAFGCLRMKWKNFQD